MSELFEIFLGFCAGVLVVAIVFIWIEVREVNKRCKYLYDHQLDTKNLLNDSVLLICDIKSKLEKMEQEILSISTSQIQSFPYPNSNDDIRWETKNDVR